MFKPMTTRFEIWRNISGYENLYQVSNLGNVRSLNYNLTGKAKNLKAVDGGKGYLIVSLSKNGKRKHFQVHRLVAIAFCENPNPDKYNQINHKDENKKNNRFDNLEWCDSKYNANYGMHNERMRKSLMNRKDRSKKVKCIETGEVFASTKEVERQKGFAHTHISAACRGVLKQAYKYHWAYI